MRKLYETEWHGIPFSSVTTVSSQRLADVQFYRRFYEEFFKRYSAWNDLPEFWRDDKRRCAALVVSHALRPSRILSVGCGLGFMEHCISAAAPSHELFIHEVAAPAWRWITREIPADHRYLGLIPECLPAGAEFDLVYLSAVDYALPDERLIGLLSSIRLVLSESGPERGECLIVSPSYQPEPATLTQTARTLAGGVKARAVAAIEYLGFCARGQFWGWARTRSDYQRLMRQAGFDVIRDGFVPHTSRPTFWVSGR